MTTLTYSYDANGNLSHTVSSDANGVDTIYNWDEANRLQEVNRGVSGKNTKYTYDNAGNLQVVAYPNLATTTYNYNTLNRLTDLSIVKSTTTLATFNYNPSGRTLGKTGIRRASQERIYGPQGTLSREADYEYDHLYRLTSETIATQTGNTLAGVPTGTITYDGTAGYSDNNGYDRVGNRRSRNANLNTTITGLDTVNWRHDNDDRLVETRAGTVWGSGTLLKTEAYDANGNTTDGRVHSTAIQTSTGNPDKYDFENRLIDRGGGQVKYVYDGDGRRVKKLRGTETFVYVLDDRNPTGYSGDSVGDYGRSGSIRFKPTAGSGSSQTTTPT